MSGDLYIFMQCLYTLLYQDEIKALNEIFSFNNQKVNTRFDISQQNIKDEFKLNFDEEVKKSIFRMTESNIDGRNKIIDGSLTNINKETSTKRITTEQSISKSGSRVEPELYYEDEESLVRPRDPPYS